MKIRTIVGVLLVLALVLGSTGVVGAASICPNPDCPNPDCPNPDCPNPDCPNPDCPKNHDYGGPGPHGANS
jgi:hypothetical protein